MTEYEISYMGPDGYTSVVFIRADSPAEASRLVLNAYVAIPGTVVVKTAPEDSLEGPQP